MNNGDLVVVNKPGNHFHGYVGVYEDRGEGYETVMVVNGCSKLSVYPKDLKPYSFDTCGPVVFPAGDRFDKKRPHYVARKDESGWWVVVDENDEEIDCSGDGGFLSFNAEIIAEALNLLGKRLDHDWSKEDWKKGSEDVRTD